MDSTVKPSRIEAPLAVAVFGHEIREHRPLHADRRRETRSRGRQRIGSLNVAGTVADLEIIEAKAALDAARRKPQHVQGAQRRSGQRNTDADNAGLDLHDVGGDAAFTQRDRKGHAADPGADNQDALYRRHRFLRETVRIFRYYCVV